MTDDQRHKVEKPEQRNEIRKPGKHENLTEDQIERIAFLVGDHHTLTGIDGLDYQILIEADYIVNAAENGYSKENVSNFIEKVMKTEAGTRITAEVFGI